MLTFDINKFKPYHYNILIHCHHLSKEEITKQCPSIGRLLREITNSRIRFYLPLPLEIPPSLLGR